MLSTFRLVAVNDTWSMIDAFEPAKYGFANVVLWAPLKTLSEVNDKSWLIKRTEPLLNGGPAKRIFWHLFMSKKRALEARCDVMFCPGGLALGRFSPSVTMCRNMLLSRWSGDALWFISETP